MCLFKSLRVTPEGAEAVVPTCSSSSQSWLPGRPPSGAERAVSGTWRARLLPCSVSTAHRKLMAAEKSAGSEGESWTQRETVPGGAG